MRVPAVLALLQQGAPSPGEGEFPRALVGTCLIAAGGLDLLTALFFTLGQKPADARARKRLALIFLLAGVPLLGAGIVLWFSAKG